MSHMRPGSVLARLVVAVLVAAAAASASGHAAQAQAIAVIVNGDPVTSLDIEQRMKLLHALHRPAGRDAAMESMIGDRLKMREASRFGVTIPDSELGEAAGAYATKSHVAVGTMMGEIERAGVQKDHFGGFFKADFAFDILVKALNKGVEASETAVRAELAKGGAKSSFVQYTIRQIVLTVQPGGGDAALQARVKEAEALRAKFTSCDGGIPYAKTLPGIAIREPLNRTSTQISGPLKDLLDKMPVGHLTPPSRTGSGLELIALCSRGAPKDDTELRKSISDRLLQEHINQDAERRLKEMRGRAVVEKR